MFQTKKKKGSFSSDMNFCIVLEVMVELDNLHHQTSAKAFSVIDDFVTGPACWQSHLPTDEGDNEDMTWGILLIPRRNWLEKEKDKMETWGLPWWSSGLESACQWRGTWVRSLIWEDPTYLGATQPVRSKCWGCALEPGSHAAESVSCSYWRPHTRAHALQEATTMRNPYTTIRA